MAFFRIVLANYNSAKWIGTGLGSILSQTFDDYIVHVVDDHSSDGCLDIIRRIRSENKDKIVLSIPPCHFGYPGGTRNYGLRTKPEETGGSVYTLFMDSDDWMVDENCLERIYDTAKANGFPDVIRLPFIVLESKVKETFIPLRERSIEDISRSPYVASWTKAVRTDRLVFFPENELFEDIPQHIAQCDILDSFCYVEEPIIVWNRLKENDVSLTANLEERPEKKEKANISYWQLVADLYRLEPKRDYSKKVRDAWISFAKTRIKEEGMI